MSIPRHDATGGGRRRRRGAGFTPLNLFAASEVGLWYDPSDLTPEKLAWVAANPGFTSAQFLAAFPNHTLYQNTTGLTPVTALGQPVGLVLDKRLGPPSARFNLLTYSEQFDNAAWTKSGLNAFGSGSVANTTATTDPLGGTTSDFIQENTANSTHAVDQGFPVIASTRYTFSCYVKSSGRTWCQFVLGPSTFFGGAGVVAYFDVANGIVGTVTSHATALPSATIESIGNGWYRCTLSATTNAASGTANAYLRIAQNGSTVSYTGNGTDGLYIWGADLRVGTSAGTYQKITTGTGGEWTPGVHATQATDAARPTLQARANLLTGTTTLATQTLAVLAAQHTLSFTGTGTVTLSGTSTAGPLVGTGVGQRVSLTFTPTAGNLTLTVSGTVTDAQLERSAAFTVYQRVTTATDYADVGLPRSLTFDGTDDSLVTPSVNFTATDKMTVCAGVLRNSDAASGILVELSSDSNNQKAFSIATPSGANSRMFVSVRDNAAYNDAYFTDVAAPSLLVMSTLMDRALLSDEVVYIRKNGTSQSLTRDLNADTGGNFGNFPLFIGSRNQASQRFNGRIHQLIVRGAATDTATIQQTERFVASKTGVTL